MDYRWSDFSLTELLYNFIHTRSCEVLLQTILHYQKNASATVYLEALGCIAARIRFLLILNMFLKSLNV